MKLFLTFLTALLAALCFVQQAEAWNKISDRDRQTCFGKNRDIGEAIVNMCFKNKAMVVPSPSAKEGAWSKNRKISVWVRGTCKPAQWVPQEWCFKQFFNMCVNLGKGGKVRAKYGKGGCQDWHIKKFS